MNQCYLIGYNRFGNRLYNFASVMVTDFQICSMRLNLRLRLHKNAKTLPFIFLDKI